MPNEPVTLDSLDLAGDIIENATTSGQWIWADVPTGADYVTYDNGQQTLWQRPVANAVIFPHVASEAPMVVAYGSHGNELGRVQPDWKPSRQPGLLADITDDQWDAITQHMSATLRTCLVRLGGTLTATELINFDPGIDDQAAWNQCVTEAQAEVTAQLAALNVHFFDPTTQQPSAENSPYPTYTVGTDVTTPGR
jgi:hypothetical protein